ncbi:hypothetical protein ABII15_00850 [Streptomyces sp. HUAS MG91]|uniref:Uncharacterized protein n=2 Tax=Streptomyces tabacisoli TaxID=3156398 RepID=A0AAU8J5K8_9ACTN
MDMDDNSARLRLDRALERVASTFRGATAREDEAQCDCHWGGEEELALLKIPDVELGPDLLYRTWNASDWKDHGAVLRRILPEFSRALAGGQPMSRIDEVGRSFSRGGWQEWPEPQRAAVWEFLHAWWAWTLRDPSPAVPAHQILALCAEASATLGPWLRVWEEADHRVADRHLVVAADRWEYHLLGDELPWDTWENEDDLRAELATWLVRHAPPRLRAQHAPDELLHRIRLIGLTGPARWSDPHFPNRRY